MFVRHLPAAEPTRSLPLGDTWKDGHVRDKHVKDAAQDVAEDVTQDAAEDVLGAADDGSPSVSGGRIIITPVSCSQLPQAAPYSLILLRLAYPPRAGGDRHWMALAASGSLCGGTPVSAVAGPAD